MQLALEHEAVRIDPIERVVHFVTSAGDGALRYDRLIVATGARPVRPPLPGIDSAGVHVLHTVDHALELERVLDESGVGAAVIVGAGYIGLEMAEALLHGGLKVTVVEQDREVLPTVDPSLGALLREELFAHGAQIATGTAVAAIEPVDRGLQVVDQGGRSWDGQVVLVSVGVEPAGELAAAAGVQLGQRHAIRVDRRLATNVPAVWAAGDCAETHHHLLERSTYLPLGTTAHKQGRIAGENAIGGSRVFDGCLGTQVVKVLDLVAARTGLRDDEARQAGFDPLTVHSVGDDHKAYYPGARKLHIAVTGDRTTGAGARRTPSIPDR